MRARKMINVDKDTYDTLKATKATTRIPISQLVATLTERYIKQTFPTKDMNETDLYFKARSLQLESEKYFQLLDEKLKADQDKPKQDMYEQGPPIEHYLEESEKL